MIDQLKEVAERIEKLGINYMLSGSLAMGFYTIQRSTKDIDLVIELERAKVSELVSTFQEDYYCYAPSVE